MSNYIKCNVEFDTTAKNLQKLDPDEEYQYGENGLVVIPSVHLPAVPRKGEDVVIYPKAKLSSAHKGVALKGVVTNVRYVAAIVKTGILPSKVGSVWIELGEVEVK